MHAHADISTHIFYSDIFYQRELIEIPGVQQVCTEYIEYKIGVTHFK